MVKKSVRLFIEGGGDQAIQHSDFRRSWKKFLGQIHDKARTNGFHSLEIVCGGGRQTTYEQFCNSPRQHPNDVCALVVDAEGPLAQSNGVWETVSQRSTASMSKPKWASADDLFLMVELLETWLVADVAALNDFFGKHFDAKALPTNNLEQRSKADILKALEKATAKTKKGPYSHGHSHLILEKVDPAKIKALTHGGRLFTTLEAKVSV